MSSLPHEGKNSNREELTSMMKCNGAENSEKTIENDCFSNEELKDQVFRKLKEMDTSLDTKIMQAIDTVITESLCADSNQPRTNKRRITYNS